MKRPYRRKKYIPPRSLVTVRLPQELIYDLDIIAQMSDLDRSKAIITLLKEAVQSRKRSWRNGVLRGIELPSEKK